MFSVSAKRQAMQGLPILPRLTASPRIPCPTVIVGTFVTTGIFGKVFLNCHQHPVDRTSISCAALSARLRSLAPEIHGSSGVME
jgi:hypothetical protein